MEWKLNNGWNMTKIAVNNVSRIFESKGTLFKSVDDINFQVKEGEFLCILGPSGCGKSTILNIIAGLLEPTEGTVDTYDKKIGYMFQKDHLF